MAEELRTAAQKAQDYIAMGHSIALVEDAVRAGSDTAEELRDTVSRNVEHLELMVALEDWGDEDMTAANEAITHGKDYVAS